MKRRILIIDDDEGIQDLLKIIFEKAGYNVTVDPNGDCIMKGTYTDPDVILLDKQLAGTDGLVICSHLKKTDHTRNIPVIMISASPDVRRLSLGVGADDFMEKPFNVAELINCVNMQLNKRLN